jgi:hypothetical protein
MGLKCVPWYTHELDILGVYVDELIIINSWIPCCSLIRCFGYVMKKKEKKGKCSALSEINRSTKLQYELVNKLVTLLK